MDRGKTLRVLQWLERREARVQAEVAVEIDDIRAGHGDARPLAIVQRVAVRHYHVEPVHGAALEETNQDRAATGGNGRQGFVRTKGGPGQEQRVHAEAEQSHSSRLHEDTSRDGHLSFLQPLPPSAASCRPCRLIASETPAPRSRARWPGRAPARGLSRLTTDC